MCFEIFAGTMESDIISVHNERLTKHTFDTSNPTVWTDLTNLSFPNEYIFC